MELAKRDIAAAQGRPYDPTDAKQAGLFLLLAPHRLGCFVAGLATHDWDPSRFGPPADAVDGAVLP
jgi:hypothetical protein